MGETHMMPRRGTLLTKIEDHNRYNGFLFTVIEFGATAAVTAGMAITSPPPTDGRRR
jgi:hypothetical protein